MIKAIIFDCFGVLYVDVKESLLKTLPPETVSELRDIYKQNDYGLLAHSEYLHAVSTLLGKTEQEIKDFETEEHRFNKELGDYIVLTLKPHYKIGMLSNIGRDWINDFFDANQLHDMFDAVVLSGEEGITKPHPRIYEIMAERLGLQPHECLMIDDIESNCAGADAVGMKTIRYISNQQTMSELKKLLT